MDLIIFAKFFGNMGSVKALAKQLRQNDRSLDEIESCFDGDAHRRLGGFNGTFGFVSVAVWLDFGKSVPRCKQLKILKCDSMHYDRGVFTVLCVCFVCLVSALSSIG